MTMTTYFYFYFYYLGSYYYYYVDNECFESPAERATTVVIGDRGGLGCHCGESTLV